MEQIQFDSSMLESTIVRYERYLASLYGKDSSNEHDRATPMLKSLSQYCNELNAIRNCCKIDGMDKLTTILYQNEFSFLDKGDYYNCRGLVYYFLNTLNVMRDLFINNGDFDIKLYSMTSDMKVPYIMKSMLASKFLSLFKFNEETKRFDGVLKDSISADIKALDKLTQEVLPKFEESLRSMDYDSRYLNHQIEQKKSLGDDTTELDNAVKELASKMATLQKNIENTIVESDKLYDILIKQYDEIEKFIYDTIFIDIMETPSEQVKSLYHFGITQENTIDAPDGEGGTKKIVRREYFILHDSLSFELANSRRLLG